MEIKDIILEFLTENEEGELPHKKSTRKENVASKMNLLEKEG
ncbi:hypothetical protein [Kosmotoga sp.]|nr:hypothetical protein [Kosmotoga sp.]